MSAPDPTPSGQSPSAARLDPRSSPQSLFALVAGSLGPLAWVLGFFGAWTNAVLTGLFGLTLVGASVLAAMRVLPNLPNTMPAAAPLSVFSTFAILQAVLRGGSQAVPGFTVGFLAILLLVIALAQCAAVVVVVLLDAGLLAESKFARFARTKSKGDAPDGRTTNLRENTPPPPPWGQAHPAQAPGQAQQPRPYAGQYPGGWSPQNGPQSSPQQSGGWPPAPGTPQGGVGHSGQLGQLGQPGVPGGAPQNHSSQAGASQPPQPAPHPGGSPEQPAQQPAQYPSSSAGRQGNHPPHQFQMGPFAQPSRQAPPQDEVAQWPYESKPAEQTESPAKRDSSAPEPLQGPTEGQQYAGTESAVPQEPQPEPSTQASRSQQAAQGSPSGQGTQSAQAPQSVQGPQGTRQMPQPGQSRET